MKEVVEHLVENWQAYLALGSAIVGLTAIARHRAQRKYIIESLKRIGEVRKSN